jgi:hypothetical protein
MTELPTYSDDDDGDSAFTAGYKKGQEVAEEIWVDNGSDCSYVWNFEDDVKAEFAENCPDNNSFCRGVRAGGNSVVQHYEKKCLEDTSDECDDLGKAAAQEIAYDYCPFAAFANIGPESTPNYKEACREAAYGVCKGAVGDQVNDNGCDNIPTSDLLRLQNKCVGQVNEMTGGDENIAFIPTYNPTLSPTFAPTVDGWKGALPEPYYHSWKNKRNGSEKDKRGGKRKGHSSSWDE